MVKARQLRAAERAILEHVARYRLTTPEILAAAHDRTVEEASIELERLVEKGCLTAGCLTPADAMNVCYQLTPRAAEHLGHDPAFARPLALTARVECFAVAKFCCCGEQFRQLYTKKEFVTKFQAIWHPGQPVRYYLEPGESGRSRLAFLKVDGHGLGQWDRLIDSCARFVQQRTDIRRAAPRYRPQVEAYAELVRQDRFQFSVLTALEDKKRAIEVELDQRGAAGIAVPPIRVYVVPNLWEVMFPAPAIDALAS